MNRTNVLMLILSGAILSLILVQGLMCAVPPVSRDALTHHLAIPKMFDARGGMVELPDIPFSYYPMNLDLLYWAALVFVNDVAPKYVHFFFGLLTGGLLYRYLLPRFGILLSLLGALIWLSTPIVVRLSTEVYVDLGLGLFSFAAVGCIIRWVRTGFQRRYVMLGGVFCGLALGTKYNALLVLAILSLAIPFIYSRLNRSTEDAVQPAGTAIGSGRDRPFFQAGSLAPSLRALGSAFLFIAMAMVVFSPWMIRNTVLKGNPLFPMFQGIFDGDEKEGEGWSRTATQETFSTFKIRRMVFKETYGEIALLPLRIFWEGRDDDPRRFDGRLNPWMLVFGMAAFIPALAEKRSSWIERWIWLAFIVLFILIAFSTAPIRIRYLMPVIPGMVILTVDGIAKVQRIAALPFMDGRRRMAILVLLMAAVALMLVYNGRYIVERFRKVDPIPYLSGEVTRDDYIAQRRLEYPLIQYANRHLAMDAKLLGIFVGQRRYYFEREIHFDENLLLRAVKAGSNPGEVAQYLHAQGISHLFVRLDLFQDWLERNLADEQKELFMVFWNSHVHQIESINGFALLQLHVY